MKKKSLIKIFVLLLAAGILSACAAGPRVATIPGITATAEAVYVSYGPHIYKATGFEAEKLTEAWRFPVKPNVNAQINAPALIDGERVIVGDFAKVLHVLDDKTGAETTNFTGATGWYQAQAVRDGDLVIVPNNDKKIYAIKDSGEIAWTYETKYAYLDNVVVDNGLVYVAQQDKKLVALDQTSGTEKWSVDFTGALPSAPLYDPDTKALYAGGLGRSVSAVDAITGKLLWTSNADGRLASIWGTPVMVDGNLIVSDEKGQLIAFDPKTGAVRWNIEGSGKTMAGPLAIPGGVVVVTEDGTAKAYKDGALKPTWTQSISYEDKKDIRVFTTPILADDTVIIAAQMDRNANVLLVGFDLNGNQQWTFSPQK